MNYYFPLFLVLTCIFENEAVIGGSIHKDINEFSGDLYKKLTDKNTDNLVYSCYSIFNIMTMTYLGAKGNTATQLKSALKLKVSNQVIEKDFKEIGKVLEKPEHITIETANKAYLAHGLKIEPEFSKTAVDTFDASVENVDFSEPKKAAEKINSWVEKETHNKIQNIIDEDSLSNATRLVLVNTLYFNGKWMHPFVKDNTQETDFHNTKSDTVKVEMMEMSANLHFCKDHSLGVSILRLPYENTKAELVIVLPEDIEGLKAVENNVEKLWENRHFSEAHVNVFLPKFKVETFIDMIPILKKLGVTDLFKGADLTGIIEEPVTVTSITQKTFIDVNEYGTEAASASTLVADRRSGVIPNPKKEVFNVNRPFIFTLLFDGIELLSGRVQKL